MRSWSQLCADPVLKNLPYKIETNRWGQIMMSPASFWHSWEQDSLQSLLKRLLPEGIVVPECPVQTTDGVRVPDVVWMPRDLFRLHKRADVLPIAPDICIEVMSPCNSREEMLAKMQLYFAAGAKEVWVCDEEGNMEFFLASQPGSAARSVMCPEFPQKVDLEV